MPPVIAFLIAVGVSAGLTITAAVIVANVIVIGLLVGAALLLAPGVPKPAAVQTPLKSPRQVRKSAFGTVRVSGPYVCFEAANQVSYDVIACLDGASNAIVRHYLHDDVVLLDGSDAVLSPDGKKYGLSGRVHFYSNLGANPETAFAAVVAGIPSVWTSQHRGDGVTSIALTCLQAKPENQLADFPNGLPAPGVAVQAQLVFDPRTGLTAWSDNPILCLLAYMTTAKGGMGLDYTRRFLPAIEDWKDAADDCDIAVGVANEHATLNTGIMVGATSVVLTSVTGIVAGTVLIFPTESHTVLTVGGLLVQFVGGMTVAQPAGTSVSWATGSAGERRYRSSGVYNHDTSPSDVVTQLLATCDGWLAQRGDGAFTVRSGRYSEPTITISDQHVVGYSLQHYLEDEKAVNELLPSYTDPATEYQENDAGSWRDQDDIDARGVVRSQPLPIPWCPSGSQARRLAKRAMSRLSSPVRGSFITNLYGMNALGERYLRLQVSENATIANIVAEITHVSIDLSTMTLTFEFIQASSDIDEWSTGEEIPGGEINARPVATPFAVPVITAATAFFETAGSGGYSPRIRITVTDPGVSNISWRARWRVTDASSPPTTVWNTGEYVDIDPGPDIELDTGFVTVAASVDVEVQYFSSVQTSDWSATTTVSTVLDTVPPAAPTLVTATVASPSVDLSCRNPSSTNFNSIRFYRNSTNSFGTASALGAADIEGAPGATTTYIDTPASGTWFYWAVAKNGSGTASSAAASTPTSVTI